MNFAITTIYGSKSALKLNFYPLKNDLSLSIIHLRESHFKNRLKLKIIDRSQRI